jgi:hypothetical protein
MLTVISLGLAILVVTIPEDHSPEASDQSRPTWRFSEDARRYSWEESQYGPKAIPRRVGQLERSERRISAGLAEHIDHIELKDRPFGEFIESYLKDSNGLPITVDWKNLAANAAPINPDTPVTVDIWDATVGQVLDEVLMHLSEGAASEDEELDYFVLRGRIHVSTRGRFDRKILTRVYDLAQLGTGAPHYRDSPEVGIPQMEYGIPGDSAPVTERLRLAGTSTDVQRNFEGLREQLIHLMTEVRPSTWKENGGRGSISIFGTKLVVRQSPAMHELIGGKWW